MPREVGLSSTSWIPRDSILSRCSKETVVKCCKVGSDDMEVYLPLFQDSDDAWQVAKKDVPSSLLPEVGSP